MRLSTTTYLKIICPLNPFEKLNAKEATDLNGFGKMQLKQLVVVNTESGLVVPVKFAVSKLSNSNISEVNTFACHCLSASPLIKLRLTSTFHWLSTSMVSPPLEQDKKILTTQNKKTRRGLSISQYLNGTIRAVKYRCFS